MMSWGEYFEGFNVFLLNNLPMYNKFRVPSMTIVIPTFLFCMMAVMTLQKIISYPDRDELWNRYKKGLMLAGGIFLLLLVFYFTSDFMTQNDRELSRQAFSTPGQQQDYIRNFLNALKEDRQSLFLSSCCDHQKHYNQARNEGDRFTIIIRIGMEDKPDGMLTGRNG